MVLFAFLLTLLNALTDFVFPHPWHRSLDTGLAVHVLQTCLGFFIPGDPLAKRYSIHISSCHTTQLLLRWILYRQRHPVEKKKIS